MFVPYNFDGVLYNNNIFFKKF